MKLRFKLRMSLSGKTPSGDNHGLPVTARH